MSNSERADNARPDVAAFKELEKLINVLGSEMAGWRRRAQLAETRLKEGGGRDASHAGPSSARESELKKENADLKRRLNAAKLRTQQLLDRVRFLRQQHEMELDR
ncbi:MAG TPA: hypothetical protein VJ672_17465 [Gemmatimonadaceae bacterium]|nr:hypothetical protein [Gemmatimonadaceae bacterium]